MGLMIHSLGELPATAQRGYYVYLLDYNWHEPLGEALRGNFARMADEASRSDAVVVQGVVGAHFVDEVLSWHHVNGQPGDEILPAILVTTRNPHEFRQSGAREGKLVPDDRMLLIPLRKACKTTGDVAVLLNKLFGDIREKKKLTEFEIARELRAGRGGAIVDALILQPNMAGIGINLNVIIDFLSGRKR